MGRTLTVAAGLEERLRMVHKRVTAAAVRANRDPAAVTVVAVTKTVDRATVDTVYAAGLRHFGENRVADAAEKFASHLPDDAALHMVGQLQSNKARPAARLFSVVESVDRPSLIEALEKEAAARDKSLAILLQVNIAGESQKAGCAPDAASALIELACRQRHLAVRGLMTIAPMVTDPEDARLVFRSLRQLRDQLEAQHPTLSLPVLSMGMTNDYDVAIEEGATEVRIGRAIFG